VIAVLAAEAESDLEAIAEYVARDSVTAALSLVHELREKCFALAEAPRSYPLAPRYEHHGIRRRPFGSYLIFYRVGAKPSRWCISCTARATMSLCSFLDNEVANFS
jgi:plasmid stabilization system protein ParE